MKISIRFPKGRAKALTLSYDDGMVHDIRLIEIMKRHGLKGTFNLNSGKYAEEGQEWPEGYIYRRMSRNMSVSVYKDSGMEVAVHGLPHPSLATLPVDQCAREVLQDRINLEREYGTIIRGMAYPYSSYNDSVVEVLKLCGIAYSRTTVQTERFDIPPDWLRLPSTCHHANPRLMEIAGRFVEEKDPQEPMLFYVWGHSYEFEEDNSWHIMEEFGEYVGGRDDVWYATNIEVYDYISAFQQLRFSVDQSIVHNPTGITLYFKTPDETVEIKPNETLHV